MPRNYFTVAFRNLRRQSIYSFINGAGLAIGMACCLLILLFVHHELSFDRYHTDADRLYRLTRFSQTPEGYRGYANTSAAAGPALKADFPAVEEVVRFMLPMPREIQVQHEETRFMEPGLYWVDASVFDVFDFHLLRGDPSTALVKPFSLVITPDLATKYFGDSDPMGQILTLKGWEESDYRITGVLEGVPETSHLQFDMLASLSGEVSKYPFLFDGEGQWSNSAFYTYALLRPDQPVSNIESGLAAFADRHMGDFARSRGFEPGFSLQAVPDIHLRSDLAMEREPIGNVRYILLFAAIAGFILVIASINFMNLATASAGKRLTEIGLRKVLGAGPAQLARQFFVESFVMTTLSMAGSLVLVVICLPSFNELTGKQLSLSQIDGFWLPAAAVGLVLLVGVFAGGYPSLFLSSFKPIEALKGRMHRDRSGSAVRKGLVVFQFTLSILLLIATFVAYHQLDYLRNKPLGFDKEQTLLLPLDGALRADYQEIKATIVRYPTILGAAASSGVPGNLRLIDRFPVSLAGASGEAREPMYIMGVDFDFLELINVDWAAGRNFAETFSTDPAQAFILTELAVERLGLENPIGAQITLQEGEGKTGTVVGVVKDFHLQSLHHPLEPIVLHIWPERFTTLSVKVQSADMAATLAFLEGVWADRAPDVLFSYHFFDETLAAQYQFDTRLGQLLASFAFLAILIACLGMLGLVAYMAERRVKEMGVRKVLGASAGKIVQLLSAEFLYLIGIAFVIASPIAYLAMERWLEGYAYRIDISWKAFGLAGLITIVISLSTVAYHSLRTALSNPVEALRHE